jgi:hypothetical protein
MRHFIAASLIAAGAIPLGAQDRAFSAGFSQSAYAEPTFFISREAYVAVFEVLAGDRVVQRYPRVEAQAAATLPAGESTLAWLDVNLGRIVEAPGTRTVFYRDDASASAGFPARAAIARTMILVASTERLRIGASADFLARFRDAYGRLPAGPDEQDRTVAAVTEVARPDDPGAEVVTKVQTMWVVSYPEFRSAATSAYANDAYGYGSACDAIAPWGYAAYATWTNTVGCPNPYVAYFPGAYFFALPRFPFGYGPYAATPFSRGPTGVAPAGPFVPAGSSGVHHGKPLTTQTLPAVDMPAPNRGGVVFAGPAVDHRPIDGRGQASGLREEPVQPTRRVGPAPVVVEQFRPEPARSAPAPAPAPAPRPTETVRSAAPHPVVVAPSHPATAGAAAHPAPARQAAPVTGAKRHDKRN